MKQENMVLLVDDEKNFVDTLAKRLRRRGFDILVSYTAEDAKRLAEENRLSAAVLDVNLPDGDGHELFEDLSAIHPEIKIVMLTGYGDIQKAFQLGKKGLCQYFGKPCDIEELEQALLVALDD